MRNTIFTSVGVLALGSAAFAEIPTGCFERQYSADHIQRHPAQIVDYLRIWIYPWPEYNQINADMVARFMDQGRIKGKKSAGKTLDQVLTCWDMNRGAGCAVDCDGGSFQFVKVDEGGITIETGGLTMGVPEDEGCGGAETLTEVIGEPVRYRLARVDDAICEAAQ